MCVGEAFGLDGQLFAAQQRGHTFLARFGAPDWFSLSNLDLAACLYRRDFLDSGGRLTDAQAQIGRGLGIKATVLPMS